MNTTNRNYPLPGLSSENLVLDDLASIKAAISNIDTDLGNQYATVGTPDHTPVNEFSYTGAGVDMLGFDFQGLNVDYSAGSVFKAIWEEVEFASAATVNSQFGFVLGGNNQNYEYKTAGINTTVSEYFGTSASARWRFGATGAISVKYLKRISMILELHANGAYGYWKVAYSGTSLHNNTKYSFGYGSVGFGRGNLGNAKPSGMYLYGNNGAPLIVSCANARLYKSANFAKWQQL